MRKSEVDTEAMRIARGLVKGELKRQGVKVSWVEASEITRAAKHLLANDLTIYVDAKRSIRRREYRARRIRL